MGYSSILFQVLVEMNVKLFFLPLPPFLVLKICLTRTIQNFLKCKLMHIQRSLDISNDLRLKIVDAIDRLNGEITMRKHVKVQRCIKNRLVWWCFSLQIPLSVMDPHAFSYKHQFSFRSYSSLPLQLLVYIISVC